MIMHSWRTIALMASAFLVWGCGSPPTEHAKSVQPSGFLKDYSRLQKAEGEGALLTYRAPELDFSNYDKAVVEPVVIWQSVDSEYTPEYELKHLAFEFYTQLRVAMRKHFEVVDEPGPRTLRIRAALTEATESRRGMKIWSNIGPLMRLYSRADKLATGTAPFVGAASVEMEMTDAATGDVLAAAVDRRVGTRTLKGTADSWGDVELAFRAWGQQLDQWLRREKAKKE